MIVCLVIALSILTRIAGLNYNIYQFAGLGTTGSSTGTGGKATSAALNQPRSIWQDTLGSFYVTEMTGNCMRKIDVSTYIVSAYAATCGNAATTSSGDNGPATSSVIYYPIGLFIDSTSRHYIAEFGGNRLRTISSSNIITTYVGTGVASSTGNNGKSTAATVNGICGVWANTVGYVFIIEFSGQLARGVQVTTTTVFAIAGKYIMIN